MNLIFNPFRQLVERNGSRIGSAPSVAAGHRYYVIGDIHGRADLLTWLFSQIRDDATMAPPGTTCVVVFLGDYIDRGPDSRGVLDQVLDGPLEGFKQVCLRGNHEDALLHFLEEPQSGGSWFAMGGQATALSYGVRIPKDLSPRDRFEHVWLELRLRLPLEHLELLSNMQLMHVSGDYLFVHAGVRPGVPLERQDPDDLMWIRSEFLRSRDDFGKVVVHGHAAREKPEIKANRIGIDTMAYASNVLTCLVLESDTRRFIDTARVNDHEAYELLHDSA